MSGLRAASSGSVQGMTVGRGDPSGIRRGAMEPTGGFTKHLGAGGHSEKSEPTCPRVITPAGPSVDT